MPRRGSWRKILLVVSVLIFIAITLKYKTRKVEEKIISHERDYVLHQTEEDLPKSLPFHEKRNDIVTSEGKPGKINVYKVENLPVKETSNVYKAALRTWRGNTTIFLHNPKHDMISSYVKDYGTWEEEFLNQIGKLFQHNKHLTFLDIGCNIGVYTLFISKLGAKVLAIDAVEDNLKLLSKSVQKGNLTGTVMLVWNALSDSHKNVSILVPEGNIGGAHIAPMKPAVNVHTLHSVESIVLDDLVKVSLNSHHFPLLGPNEKLFIKIDIEGNEDKVLIGGQTFFQTVNVVGIFMEWMHHRYRQSGQTIVNILIKNGFLPYETITMSKFLNPDEYYKWPENIFWMKR